jgi:hypothetical protein
MQWITKRVGLFLDDSSDEGAIDVSKSKNKYKKVKILSGKQIL